MILMISFIQLKTMQYFEIYNISQIFLLLSQLIVQSKIKNYSYFYTLLLIYFLI